MNYDQVMIKPNALWRLLSPKVQEHIEQEAGMPYRRYRLRMVSAVVIFLLWFTNMVQLAILYDGRTKAETPDWVIPSMFGSVAVGLIVIGTIIGSSREAGDVFRHRLQSAEGFLKSVCECGIGYWPDIPDAITEICYRGLRSLGEDYKSRAEFLKLLGGASEREDMGRVLFFPLKSAHNRLRGIGFPLNEKPEYYLHKHMIGG